MTNKIIRVITRAANGTLRTKEFENFEEISSLHDQIGIDDCSTDLTLRGLPLFRGLVGPMPESKTTVRYESPDVFEFMTKEWAHTKTKRKRRTKSATANETPVADDTERSTNPKHIPIPNFSFGTPSSLPIVNLT